MGLLLLYLFLALSISFLCSLMESVLLSTPLSFIKANEEKMGKGMKKLAVQKQNIDKPLSAILSLNTVAHTVGAAGVGAQATYVFGEAYFGIVSAILTLLILVLTEIIPKTIGANYWRSMGSLVGYMIFVTTIISYPLVVLSAVLTRIISPGKSEQTTSREEISALAQIGTTEGIFHESENMIIQNVIKLKNIRVNEIMTPRTVMSIADENMQLDDFLKQKDFMRFSRIPVYTDNRDNITGYVFRQMVFEKLAEHQDGLKLKNIKKDIVIVPETKQVFGLWEQLLSQKEHIALVVDEYGGVDGIVTMEDIIETLVGFEIVDEKDTIVDMQQYARDRWQKRQTKYKYLEIDSDANKQGDA